MLPCFHSEHSSFPHSFPQRLYLLAQSLPTQHCACWHTMYEKVPQLACKTFLLPKVPPPPLSSFISPFATWARYFLTASHMMNISAKKQKRTTFSVGGYCVFTLSWRRAGWLGTRINHTWMFLPFSDSSMPSHIISLHSHIIFIGEISADEATSLKNAMASTDVI